MIQQKKKKERNNNVSMCSVDWEFRLKMDLFSVQ